MQKAEEMLASLRRADPRPPVLTRIRSRLRALRRTRAQTSRKVKDHVETAAPAGLSSWNCRWKSHAEKLITSSNIWTLSEHYDSPEVCVPLTPRDGVGMSVCQQQKHNKRISAQTRRTAADGQSVCTGEPPLTFHTVKTHEACSLGGGSRRPPLLRPS